METRPMANELLLMVANDYNVSIGDVVGSGREFEAVDVRTIIAMTLLKFGHTKKAISKVLDKKDHTTIINLVRRGEKREDLKVASEKYYKILNVNK